MGDRRTASARYGLGTLRSRKRGCWRKEGPTGQTATKASSETSTDGANAAAVVAGSSAVAVKHVQNPWLMFNQLSPWPWCHSSICTSEVSQTAWRRGWIRAPSGLSSSTALPSAIWECQGVRIAPLCGIRKWTRWRQIKLEAVSMFTSLSRGAGLVQQGSRCVGALGDHVRISGIVSSAGRGRAETVPGGAARDVCETCTCSFLSEHCPQGTDVMRGNKYAPLFVACL